MLLNYTEVSPIKKEVEIEIPADMIAAESARLALEYSREADIPGFRPGKVPVSVIRSRFGKELRKEVTDNLISRTLYDFFKEKGLETVGDPRLNHVDTFIEGAPLRYKAEFEIKPQFELAEYRGIEIEDPKIEVTEHDVESMIERFRDEASSYRLEGERGIQDGDIAVIEIDSTWGEGQTKHDSGHFRVGESSPLPEMHEKLQGKVAGDTITVEKEYGEDATNEDWRGQKVRHDITLKEIRVQEKPDVTDEFAKSVGNWETVDEMRQALTEEIRRHREHEVLRMKKSQIGDHLLATHELEAPKAMVEEELGKSLKNYARFLATQGVDLENADLDWPKVSGDFRPEAVKRVKRSLILEAIAKKEKLTVSDVEIDAEIRRAANESNRDFAEVRHNLKQDGGYEELRGSLAQEKALDLLLRESKPK